MGRAGVNPAGSGSALTTHIVDVELDPETGKVQILRYTAVQNVGKAIPPSSVEGLASAHVPRGCLGSSGITGGLKEWDRTPTRRWGWPLMVPQSDTVRAACRKDETERTHLEKR